MANNGKLLNLYKKKSYKKCRYNYTIKEELDGIIIYLQS